VEGLGAGGAECQMVRFWGVGLYVRMSVVGFGFEAQMMVHFLY
jgi:hypothetical protein